MLLVVVVVEFACVHHLLQQKDHHWPTIATNVFRFIRILRCQENRTVLRQPIVQDLLRGKTVLVRDFFLLGQRNPLYRYAIRDLRLPIDKDGEFSQLGQGFFRFGEFCLFVGRHVGLLLILIVSSALLIGISNRFEVNRDVFTVK